MTNRAEKVGWHLIVVGWTAMVIACAGQPAAAQVTTVGPPVQVDSGGIAAANEVSVVVQPSVPTRLIIGWNDWRESGSSEVIRTAYAISRDGAMTWSDELLRPPPLAQDDIDGDPMTAIDPRTGTMWAGGIAFTQNGGVYVARLDPGASVFAPSVLAFDGAADKGWMAAGPRPGEPDSTRVYIAFNRGLIWSDDMGGTWTAPVQIGSGLGHLPRVGPGGEVYIAWWDLNGNYLLTSSFDGGQSFVTLPIATRLDAWGFAGASRFPGTFRVPPLIHFDVDPRHGALSALYCDTTEMIGADANVDVYFTRSTDQGATWSAPAVINTDAVVPGDQFFSWLETDDAGRLHAVFLDSRHTAQADGTQHGMLDVYYAWSGDDGATWEEIRLTSAPWDSDDDGLNRVSQFIGDYLGLDVAGNRAYPAYLSTAGGDPDIYVHEILHTLSGDLNDDGRVNVIDLLTLIAAWGACPAGDCPGDLTGDAVVDVQDLLFMLARWTG